MSEPRRSSRLVGRHLTFVLSRLGLGRASGAAARSTDALASVRASSARRRRRARRSPSAMSNGPRSSADCACSPRRSACRIEPPRRNANSRLALETGELVRGRAGDEASAAFHHAVSRAFFVDGADIGDVAVVAHHAKPFGISDDDVRQHGRRTRMPATIDDSMRAAMAAGVTGVRRIRLARSSHAISGDDGTAAHRRDPASLTSVHAPATPRYPAATKCQPRRMRSRSPSQSESATSAQVTSTYASICR